MYNSIFTRKERELFSVIAPEHDYPFPYDIPTVAFYYRSSKIFVHCADSERRCRTAGYAWACGMPVVSREDPASILPNNMRIPPYYYKVSSDVEYSSQILQALSDLESNKHSCNSYDINTVNEKTVKYFSVNQTNLKLISDLSSMLKVEKNNYSFRNLDIRLGRHHGISIGPNKVNMSLDKFVDILQSGDIKDIENYQDPEIELARRHLDA